jgi:WhiB family redox-sensing transcriptional regulator
VTWVTVASCLVVAAALMLMPAAENWRDSALCAEIGPDAFFPEKGDSSRPAKAICRSCRVRAECLQFALANDERFGIWGGLSDRERRRLRRHTS